MFVLQLIHEPPSRGNCLSSEWNLNPFVFDLVVHTLNAPQVDRLSRFLEEFLCPGCLGDSCLFHPVVGLPRVCPPPFQAFPKCLGEGCPGFSLLPPRDPLLAQRPWFLHFSSLLAGPPISLPVLVDLLLYPISRFSLWDPLSFHLTLWPFSICLAQRQAFFFLSGLPIFQLDLLVPLLDLLWFLYWMPSLSGAPTHRSIHLTPL